MKKIMPLSRSVPLSLTLWQGARMAVGILALTLLLTTTAFAKVSDINTGSIVVGYDTTCNAGNAGALRYNSGTSLLQLCYSAAWNTISAGTVAASGTIGATSGMTIYLTNGTAAAPSMTYFSATTTGLYYVASHTLDFTIGGTQRALFDANGNFNLATAAGWYMLGGNGGMGIPHAGGDTTSLTIGDQSNPNQTANNLFNFSIGQMSGRQITTGSHNTAVGANSIGNGSGTLTTGTYNTAFGSEAIWNAKTGASYNTGIAAHALDVMTTGMNNTAAGDSALYNITTGSSNTAIGAQAAQTGNFSNVTAIGNLPLGSVTPASNSTAIGGDAAYAVTTVTTCFGTYACSALTSGAGNTAFGEYAMGKDNPLGISNGAYNTAIGAGALYAIAGASGQSYNTAAGSSAFGSLTTGSNNTGAGINVGTSGTNDLTTETSLTFVGNLAVQSTTGLTNGTAIGASSILTASNSVVLGDSGINTLYGHVTTITGISDRRHKKDIKSLPDNLGIDFVNKLEPVSYRFNNGDEKQHYGFIAQDLERALPQSLYNMIEKSAPGLALVERDNDKKRTYRVGYGELFAPVVKSIQNQQAMLAEIQKDLDAQKQQNTGLVQKLTTQNEMLKSLKAENDARQKAIGQMDSLLVKKR